MGLTMDEIARRYLLLALRTDQRRPGFLAWYAGPGELAEAVAGEPLPLPVELHDEAMALAGLVAETLEPGLRRTWLEAQLDAMASAARVLDGEEIAYPELVEELLDLRVEPAPEAAFVTAHQRLDSVLPAGESLPERLAAYREAGRLAPDETAVVLERAVNLLRRRTDEDNGLPRGDRVEIVMQPGVPDHWRLVAVGAATSVLEVDPEVGWTIPDLYRLAAAVYPGWHALRVMRVQTGGELLAGCRPAPETAIGEAIAAVGREVLLGDRELESELAAATRGSGRRISFEREAAVRGAHELLASVPANVALAVLHDGMPRNEARTYLMEIGLMPADAADAVLRHLDDPLGRVWPFERSGAVGLVREWLEMSGQTLGLRRLLGGQLAPRTLRAELGEAPGLYPASFV
jgi:hypothetical protein